MGEINQWEQRERERGAIGRKKTVEAMNGEDGRGEDGEIIQLNNTAVIHRPCL